ncbi:ABC transporter substrate-binding protein [Halomonas shantousis]
MTRAHVLSVPLRAMLRSLALTLLIGLPVMLPSAQANNDAAGAARPIVPVVSLDWTLAETLLALGVAPQGVAQTDAYREWVSEPTMPEEVVDIGLRAQPNLELLAQLKPERILISPMFAALTPRLSRIAPVSNIGLYLAGGDVWSQAREAAHELARLVGRPEAAETLIAEVEAGIDQDAARLPADTPPLLIVQFIDARHVRVFGEHSLYQAVLQRLGLTSAWKEPTNAWGFSMVGLEQLASIESAQLVVIDPLPVGVADQLAESGLWQYLPSVHKRDVIRLDPVWSFGGLPSARRFADQLSKALVGRPASPSDDASHPPIR